MHDITINHSGYQVNNQIASSLYGYEISEHLKYRCECGATNATIYTEPVIGRAFGQCDSCKVIHCEYQISTKSRRNRAANELIRRLLPVATPEERRRLKLIPRKRKSNGQLGFVAVLGKKLLKGGK